MVTVEGSKIVFRFFRPKARHVHLVGDFNGWRENELRMTPNSDGYWTAVLYLPEGDYKFRYRSDGQWYTDYAAFGIQYGPLGVDGIVRVQVPVAQVKMSQPEVSRKSDGNWVSTAKPRVTRKRARKQVA